VLWSRTLLCRPTQRPGSSLPADILFYLCFFLRQDNCVGGNVGDSFCSMARIGYYDAYSRRRLGQQDVFDDKLLAPLITYLIKNTWMHERCGRG